MMPATYQLEYEDYHSEQYPVQYLRVHCTPACGKEAKDVAAILDPYSENPHLLLNQSLSLSGVRDILDCYKNWEDTGCFLGLGGKEV
jgi:hypothetical protein